jgi:hypothetical protein
LVSGFMISAGEILPRVDVRAIYDMYFRYFLLWVVVVGLVVKFAYVIYFKRQSWSRYIAMDVAMNAVSSLLIPVSFAVAWRLLAVPRLALNRIFGTDDADPANWVPLVMVLAMIGALLEVSVIHFASKQRLGQKGFWVLCAANAVWHRHCSVRDWFLCNCSSSDCIILASAYDTCEVKWF